MAISDLDPNEPGSAGLVGQGDDEFRQLKQDLLDSFGGVDGLVTAGTSQPAATAQDFIQLFDNVAFLALAAGQNAFFVPGMVQAWGLAASPPAGWEVCDSARTVNGIDVPDLSGRFIIGTQDGVYPNGSSGGSASGNTGAGGDHNHGGNTANHSLAVAELPSALSSSIQLAMTTGGGGSNGIDHTSSAQVAGGDGLDVNTTTPVSVNGANGTGHNHDIANSGAHTHPIDTLPPYYALRWIIYVGTP